jgi:hypothetical protein
MAELEGIFVDYLQQASTWNVIPAAGRGPLIAEMREPRR